MSNGLVFFSKQQIDEAFSKGGAIYKGTPAGNFQVHAARRTSAGEAEIHEHDTDIFHIMDGAATLVTGGSVVDPRITAPGETRGPSIRDGAATRLTKGDVVIIPKGLPHWISDVEGTFLNYVVKVR